MDRSTGTPSQALLALKMSIEEKKIHYQELLDIKAAGEAENKELEKENEELLLEMERVRMETEVIRAQNVAKELEIRNMQEKLNALIPERDEARERVQMQMELNDRLVEVRETTRRQRAEIYYKMKSQYEEIPAVARMLQLKRIRAEQEQKKEEIREQIQHYKDIIAERRAKNEKKWDTFVKNCVRMAKTWKAQQEADRKAEEERKKQEMCKEFPSMAIAVQKPDPKTARVTPVPRSAAFNARGEQLRHLLERYNQLSQSKPLESLKPTQKCGTNWETLTKEFSRRAVFSRPVPTPPKLCRFVVMGEDFPSNDGKGNGRKGLPDSRTGEFASPTAPTGKQQNVSVEAAECRPSKTLASRVSTGFIPEVTVAPPARNQVAHPMSSTSKGQPQDSEVDESPFKVPQMPLRQRGRAAQSSNSASSLYGSNSSLQTINLVSQSTVDSSQSSNMDQELFVSDGGQCSTQNSQAESEEGYSFNFMEQEPRSQSPGMDLDFNFGSSPPDNRGFGNGGVFDEDNVDDVPFNFDDDTFGPNFP